MNGLSNNYLTALDCENIQAERDQYEAEQAAELAETEASDPALFAYGWSPEETVLRVKDNDAAIGCIRTHLERVQEKKIGELSARIARLEAIILATN